MLIKASEVKELYSQFNDIEESVIKRKLQVIESAIRNHTNNKFQHNVFRIQTNVVNGKINWNTSYLEVDDTIEICNGINKGIYTIKSISENGIEVDGTLYDFPMQLITKIEYPIDIIDGAIDLLNYSLLQNGKQKSGIASETISRHSVSYVQRTKDNTIKGFPIELFDFCEDYMCLRT